VLAIRAGPMSLMCPLVKKRSASHTLPALSVYGTIAPQSTRTTGSRAPAGCEEGTGAVAGAVACTSVAGELEIVCRSMLPAAAVVGEAVAVVVVAAAAVVVVVAVVIDKAGVGASVLAGSSGTSRYTSIAEMRGFSMSGANFTNM
jgi:hypothetical protein